MQARIAQRPGILDQRRETVEHPKEDTYREGIAGSSESRKTTVTDPDGGTTTTTRSKTTTK
jgi:hypothetical protein